MEIEFEFFMASCTGIERTRFSKLPNFGCHINFLRTLITKTFPDMKFCNKFAVSYVEVIEKDNLLRISGSQFLKWLVGPEKFTDFRETGRIGGRRVLSSLCHPSSRYINV